MSLYAEFLKEYKNFEIVEHEYGYATFQIVNDHCYIEDIFVQKEKRRTGLGTEIGQAVESVAKTRGCKFLVGSIVPNLPGAHGRMLALLSFGFQLQACKDNFIFLQKGIV